MTISDYPYLDYATPQVQPLPELQFSPRSRYQAFFFLPGMFLSGASYMAGGIPILTDVSFLILILVCIAQLVEEMMNFSRRFGLGGVTLFGGILVWFCHDYMKNWFFINFNSGTALFGAGTIAKSAFLHQTFIFCAVIGLHLPSWRGLENLVARIPEPATHQLYLTLILVAFGVGLIPYVFFASDSLPVAIYKDIFGGRGGGATFTTGRTGSVNSSWGAYLGQLQQIGQIGSLLAIFYLLLQRPRLMIAIACFSIWIIHVGLAFGGGTRGQTAYMFMPALFLVFLKYQSQAAELLKKWSFKAYVMASVVGLTILVILQIQITYRNGGFENVQFNEVKTDLEGNSMFSEGLAGMKLIPEQKDFFYNSFPGHGAIMAMPDLTWRFIYGPIPRALWPGKPIDPLWKWYNAVITGRPEDDLEGTTVSTGLIGDWYFRFGLAGVMEGGLLFGWLCLMSERFLQNSQGRLLQMVFSVGMLVFIFRSFRGLSFINLYPLLIGVGFIYVLTRFAGTGPGMRRE